MKKPVPVLIVFIGCALVATGFTVSVIHGIMHAPEDLAAYFTKVEHPIKPTYDSYNQFLKEVVKRDRVDYLAARANPNMDKALRALASLSCDEFGGESDRLAYWINAYNLLVIKTVSDHFPTSSIENVSNDLNSHRYTVGGQPITVKDIKQLKIQPLLRGTRKGDYTDCRMLFLIAGGAMGYPVICDHAITSESIAKDMETNTKKFIQVRYNVYFSHEMHTLYISPFFQWNAATLMQAYDDPFQFVIFYMDPNDRPDTSDIHSKQVTNRKFDWRINDIATKD
jgi:hypothetical protein